MSALRLGSPVGAEPPTLSDVIVSIAVLLSLFVVGYLRQAGGISGAGETMNSQVWIFGAALGAALALGACDLNKGKAAPAPAPVGSAVSATSAAAAEENVAVPAGKAASTGKKRKVKVAALARTVPDDWITVRDNVRGFDFQVPNGSKRDQVTKGNFTIYGAQVPKPNEIDVLVVAFKDKTRTKEDLFDDVDDVLEAAGCKDVKLSNKKEITTNFSECIVTYIDDDGSTPSKGKALVVTDKTDNYMMIAGSPAATFKVEEPTIDAIIGSLSMDSGN